MVTLRYGKGDLPIRVPEWAEVTEICKPPMMPLDDPVGAVRAALDHPVGCTSLSQLARNADSACIAICDITRPVPNHLFLRPMIECLVTAGMDVQRITILVATGLHRPNQGQELAELVGDPWVMKHVRVENHFARNDRDHIDLGRTRTRGTVVKLDRRFVEADLRIATGLVEPHFMAGYSGGRKVVAPGLAHVDTITTFHNAKLMSDPAATNCNLVGNPLHEEQLEIIRMLGGALALNTVIDDSRNLAMVNFGEIVTSHQQTVDFARSVCEVEVPRRFQTVLTCAAGYPLDKTYYQTIKGMVAALGLLEPGGDLIIASRCDEGIGSEEFTRAQRRLIDQGPDRFLESIMTKPHADIDEWQTQKQLAPMKLGRVYLYSESLSPAERALTGVQCVDSISQTVEESLRRHGDPALAVIPEGPYVIPRFQQASPKTQDA